MWRKLLFFGVLYFVQGAALAYVVNFQKPYLGGNGVSKEALGLLTSLLLLPFIAKVILGYISDRFPVGAWGSRKPYMVLNLILFALCFFGLTFVDPAKDFYAFAALIWFAAFGLAWFDACADGWAIDSSLAHEQSSIQSAMIAGKSLGLVTMSALFGFLALRHGFPVIFQIIAGLAAAVLITVLFVRHQGPSKRHGEIVHGWKSLLQEYYICFALFAIVYATASNGMDGILTLHLSETTGATAMDIGMFGMYKGCGGLIGAIAFGLIRPRLGGRNTQYAGVILLGAGCLIPLLGWPVLAASVSWGIAWGFQETAFLTLAMKFAQGRWAATLFAGSMIFANLGNSFGEMMGAPMVPRLGFDGVFIMLAALAFTSAAFIPKIYKPLKN